MTLGQSPKLLTPHPGFTGDLGWAGAPIQAPGLSCCSNKFFQGWRLGGGGAGHTQLPARGKMRQLQGLLPAPPTKRQAEGIRAAHCRARAASWGTRTAPQGPGHAFTDTQHRLPRVGIFSGSLPCHTQPGAGGEAEDAPFGRNLTSFPGRDQLIPPLPPPFLPRLCKLSPLWGWGWCDMGTPSSGSRELALPPTF